MAHDAFTTDFAESLRGGKYTSWLPDLPIDTLNLLLWNVGEFAIRAPTKYVPRNWNPEMNEARLRVALQTIARIRHGGNVDDWRADILEADKRKIGPPTPPIRRELVTIALDWEGRFGVAPAITTAISEYDAAMLVGMPEAEYSKERRGQTAVQSGHDFVFKDVRYQIKANRPSGKPGSKVTLVGKAKKYEWDCLIWILYDEGYNIREAWQWDVDAYRSAFHEKKRLSPKHMRMGFELDIKGQQLQGEREDRYNVPNEPNN